MAVTSRFHVIVFLVATLTLLMGGTDKFADDPGVGWHLQSGLWMLEHQVVPSEDPFLHSVNPRPWISDQWLSDLLLGQLFTWGGFPLIYAVLTALYLTTFFVVVAVALVRSGIPCIASTIAAFFAFKIAQVHFLLRPVIFGFFCFSLLFAALLPLYQQELERGVIRARVKQLMVLLPLLFLLWANLHPSFILGLIVLALVAVGLVLDRFFCPDRREAESQAELKRGVMALLAVCSLATVVNPYGFGLHRSILSLGSSSFFMNYHQEWLSPDFTQPEGQLFELLLFGAVAAMVLRRSTCRISMVDLSLFAFFVHASLDAVRFLPFFGIIIAPWFARFFGVFEALKHLPVFRIIHGELTPLEVRQQRYFPQTAKLIVLALLILIGWSSLSGKLPLYRGEYGPGSSAYPYQAFSRLLAEIPEGERVVLAADAEFGGFVTWQGRAKVRALLDDRNTLIGEGLYRDFERAVGDREEQGAYFRSLGAHFLMLRKKSPMASRLLREATLKVVSEDALVVIFSLATPPASSGV